MGRGFGVFLLVVIPFVWAFATLVFHFAGYDVAASALGGLVATLLTVVMIRLRFLRREGAG